MILIRGLLFISILANAAVIVFECSVGMPELMPANLIALFAGSTVFYVTR